MLLNTKFIQYILFAWFAFTGVWSGFVMQRAMGRLTDASGSSAMLDLQPNNISEDVYHYLDRTGEGGRKVLIGIYQFEDFVFPMAYGPFLLLAIAYFLNKSFPQKKYLLFLALLPIAGVCLDYIENFSIIKIVESYPTQISLASNLGKITLAKWILAGSSGLTLIIGFTAYLIGRFRHKKS